jgi:hypothetical protein
MKLTGNNKADRFHWIGLVLLAFTLSACLSTPQWNQVRKSHLSIPQKVELTNVPFHPQKKYYCGPAAVATALETHGKKYTLDDIAKRVYTPGKKGSLQIDVISGIRRYGYVAYVLEPKLEAVLKEIAAQRPVIVFQNLSIKWVPKWHYAVAVGYDIKNEQIILRSGKHKRLVTKMKVFERTWKRSNYWAVVVLKPGEMPVTAKPLRFASAVSGLEQAQQWKEANASYQAALTVWPNDLISHLGYANTFYAMKRYREAEREYRSLIKRHPDAADAYNNLANLLYMKKQYKQARQFAKRAVDLGGKHADIYRRTLQQVNQVIQ